MKLEKIFLLLLAGLLSFGLPAWADDDVLTTIEEAVRQYKHGDYAGAASNLDYASQLIRQKKNEEMKKFLPEPLEGWTAEEASAQAIATAVLGGGLRVSREYRKGPASVTIEIVSDSPVLQSVMMMLNNPMFAGAGGGRLQTINGQRAIVKYDTKTKNGEINIVAAGKFMITVSGQKVSREDLIAYAAAVDYKHLMVN